MPAPLLLALAVAHPLPDGSRIVVLCDPVRYRFSVRAVSNELSEDSAGYPQRVEIDAATLMEALPGYTSEAEVMGPLTRYVRCGPYAIKLTGDAYNTHVQGEAGAYPSFASISILRGPGTVYPWDTAATFVSPPATTRCRGHAHVLAAMRCGSMATTILSGSR